VKWSSNSGALSSWSIVGTPVPYEDILYVAARQSQGMDVSLLALNAEKGELLWQVLLGTAQAGTNYRGMPDVPNPLILPAGGAIYVVTNNGALVAVDVAARRVDWAYTYEGPPMNSRQMWWNGESVINRPKMVAHAFIDGATLYLKEEGGAAVHAVDLSGPTLIWRRPLDRDNSIMPVPGTSQLLVTGQDLGAIDAKSQTHPLQWNAPLPQLIGRINPIISGERVLAFSPRGIFELSLTNGDTVRILRGADKESIGGDLRRAPGRLISISNLAVTAYPVSDATQQAKGQ
jgi:outer membrane protein assembly factor BamB